MAELTVEEELVRFMKAALDKCHSTPFKFEQDKKSEGRAKIYDAFKESLQIWSGIRAKECEGNFTEAFFLMHLYIRLVLHMQLHRKKESNFKKVSDLTLTNLNLIEGRLEKCLNGVRRQFEQKHSEMAETRLKHKEEEVPAKETHMTLDHWDKLSPSEFRLKQVSGDGHSAFRSIAQGMVNGSLPQATEAEQALALRKGVCKLLWQHRDQDLKGIGLTVEQLVTLDPDSRHDSFRSYLNGMAISDFAGEVELILLANDLKSRIFVYQNEGEHYSRIASYGKGKKPPICLVWQRGLSESGNHYNSLLKN